MTAIITFILLSSLKLNNIFILLAFIFLIALIIYIFIKNREIKNRILIAKKSKQSINVIDENNISKKPLLIGISGYYQGNIIEFIDDCIILGRDASTCHLIFPEHDMSISRKHCKITYNNGLFVIEDYSINGTFLENGERLISNHSYVIKSQQRFYLNNLDNLFEVRL